MRELLPVFGEVAPPALAFLGAVALALAFVHDDLYKARFDVFRVPATWWFALCEGVYSLGLFVLADSLTVAGQYLLARLAIAVGSAIGALLILRGTRPDRAILPTEYSDLPFHSGASPASELQLTEAQKWLASFFTIIGGFFYRMIPDQLNIRRDDAILRLQHHIDAVSLVDMKNCIETFLPDEPSLSAKEKDATRRNVEKIANDPQPTPLNRVQMARLLIRVRGAARLYEMLRQAGVKVPPPWRRKNQP